MKVSTNVKIAMQCFENFEKKVARLVVNNDTFPNKHEWVNKANTVTFMSWALLQGKCGRTCIGIGYNLQVVVYDVLEKQ